VDPLSILLAGRVPASRPGDGEAPLDDRARPVTGAVIEELQSIARFAARSAGVSWADAEDAAQEAFLALWRAAERGGIPSEPAACRSWMRTVAFRSALRRAPDRRVLLDDDAVAALAAMSIPDEVPDLVIGHERVRSLLGGLPADEREVIALVIDGYRPREIGEVLRIPLAVAQGRAASARERLRRAIAAQAEGEEQARQPGQGSGDAELRSLPPRQREVLRLSREGYKPAQIAEALSLSPNTVRVNLHHARKRLLRDRELLSSPAA
jgi:RNA polymerase sigma-70 factor (ECF subfamily)